MNVPVPSSVLQKYLRSQRERLGRYSLRQLAKDSGFSPTHISHLINGKKDLSPSTAVTIISKLKMEREWASQLYRSAVQHSSHPLKVILEQGAAAAAMHLGVECIESQVVPEGEFHLLGEWFYLAILELTHCKDFRSNSAWIARRLNISTQEASSAIARLKKAGLLAVDSRGRIYKMKKRIEFRLPRSEEIIRRFHSRMIEKAQASLESPKYTDFKRRTITGLTVPVSLKNLPEADKRIQAFLQEMISLLSPSDSADEVYQLNLQLFPLSQPVTGVNYVG